jgi:hypothetical protein
MVDVYREWGVSFHSLVAAMLLGISAGGCEAVVDSSRYEFEVPPASDPGTLVTMAPAGSTPSPNAADSTLVRVGDAGCMANSSDCVTGRDSPACSPGDQRPCSGLRRSCGDGLQTCQPDSAWGPCAVPSAPPDRCNSGADAAAVAGSSRDAGAGSIDAGTDSDALAGTASFDHYQFARSTSAYAIEAPGLLANDDGAGRSVVIATTRTEAGGQVDLTADGAFLYTPVAPRFWGTDSFSYERADVAASASVRVTIQPDEIDAADVEAGVLDGFKIEGLSPGGSVGAAGDVNGDGLADVIVGPFDSGEAVHVVFGRRASGSIDLAQIDAQQEEGFALTSPDLGSDSIVTGVGDVNGDGLDDLVIGAPVTDAPPGIFNAGRAYVVFGKADRRPVSLADLENESAGGFVIYGNDVQAFVGRSLSAAGDVNGDGLADIVVGEFAGQGSAYVVFGKRDTGAIFLQDIGSQQAAGFAILGTGAEVAGAGDVNGDGLDDVLVGMNPPCVVFGKKDETAVQITDLQSGSGGGFVITSDRSWRTLSGAGDVNGDGLADLVLGNSTTEPGGEALVVLGKADSSPLGVQSGNSISLQGELGSNAGEFVSGAGDVNGDGLADVLIGTAPANPGGTAIAGTGYVVFGRRAVAALDLVDVSLGQRTGLVVRGPVTQFGFQVSRAGDFNGDGLDDWLLGSPSRTTVFFGWDMLEALGERQVVLLGTPGDDTLHYQGQAMVCANGGHGIDTLAFEGSGLSLDLSAAGACLRQVEILDLSGSGPNSLILSDALLRSAPENRPDAPTPLVRTLIINGDPDDSVQLIGAGAYELFGTNADRDVYRKPGAFYGLEVRHGVQLDLRPL